MLTIHEPTYPEDKEFSSPEDFIYLEEEHQDQALELSNNLVETEDKLTVYNQALAVIAFTDWLAKREPDLQIKQTLEATLQTSLTSRLNGVVNLTLGEFKVCLLPTFSFSDDIVDVPQAIVDEPGYAAHFYVVIALEDELGMAVIKGCHRYDQLVADTANIPVGSDENYEVPLECFNLSGDELLLYLQCLSPQEIPLPATVSSHQDYLRDFQQILTQRAMNLGQWLHNQVDEVAQELAWQLLSAPSPALRFRPSAAEDLAEILTKIEIKVPSAAVHSYRELNLAKTPLRLYAITWQLPQSHPDGDWTVLLILGASPNHEPPKDLKLRITDATTVLDEKKLAADCNYLYSQFIGSYQEKCLVTVINGEEKAEESMVLTFSY